MRFSFLQRLKRETRPQSGVDIFLLGSKYIDSQIRVSENERILYVRNMSPFI